MSILLDSIVVMFILTGTTLLGLLIYDGYNIDNHEYMFEKIARHVSEDYTYDNKYLNCMDFSTELHKRLTDKGYNSSIIIGYRYHNHTEGHAWVSLIIGQEIIYIDAVSGVVVDNVLYNKRYKYWRSRQMIIDGVITPIP